MIFLRGFSKAFLYQVKVWPVRAKPFVSGSLKLYVHTYMKANRIKKSIFAEKYV